MKYIVLLGRIFYSSIFVMASFGHFSEQTIGYAAAQGVPLASIAVPLSGVMALLGGLSVALGYKAKYGAWLLVLFLVPVTVMLHNFWAVTDPMMARMQQVMFMKNLTMLGSAFLIAHFGSGPLSLDVLLKARLAQGVQSRQQVTA
ncbi:MAG: DoxX family protein [Ignavibacteriae bacterium]|nr:DoxX family protein [Ignavibacteria bacterium]MBI3363879.1 DoxX family protein [Ignavibacteriota bacterium]